MADPVSMTLIAAAASKAVGSIVEGNAGSAAAKANARIAGQNADIARAQGYAREESFRRRSRMELGEQAASIAQSGVDPTSGSALRTANQSATNAELDAMNIRYEGLMHGLGFDREAALERARAKQARIGGYMGAVASILGGASDVSAYNARSASSAPSYDFWKQGYGGRY